MSWWEIWGAWLTGKLGGAWVGAWLGAWVGELNLDVGGGGRRIGEFGPGSYFPPRHVRIRTT